MKPMSPIEILHPPRERWGSVLNLALSHRPFAERLRLTDALLQPVPGQARDAGFQGLLEARQGEETVGAALAVLQPGRTALVYQPRLAEGAPNAVRAELNQALDQFLAKNGVQLAQEVLALDDVEGATHARSAGYTIDVELVYLAADAELFPQSSSPSDWHFATYEEAEQQVLERILTLTYAETLDCPEINGVRSAADTIAGYRATGDGSTRSWRLVQCGHEEIGCLLVSRHDASMAELIYMGLVPEARGKGRSTELIGWAMALAKEAGCGALSVAVDARNTPAHRAYQRAGFSEFDRRRVLLRTFK